LPSAKKKAVAFRIGMLSKWKYGDEKGSIMKQCFISLSFYHQAFLLQSTWIPIPCLSNYVFI
jgi:hypothetical protein